MDPENLIKEGKPLEALDALKEKVRDKPADADLRLFLFQLMCILGDWDKAVKQLAVVAGMKKEYEILAKVYRELLVCEKLRTDVFAGKRQPLIFGEPEAWMGEMVNALQLTAQGEHAKAAELREAALDKAPAVSGTVNGESFEWFMDGDSRLGPILEMMLDGKYYWAPMSHIVSMEIDQPQDLRDLVWAPTSFKWTNGGETGGALPVRYVDTLNSADNALLMARKTDWQEVAENSWHGLGQRMFVTDTADHPVLTSTHINFHHEGLELPQTPESGMSAEINLDGSS